MLDDKKAVGAELRNLEKMMIDVEKRLTYFLTEFAIDEDNPAPAMGKYSFEGMSQVIMHIHMETVANRERLARAQGMIHSHWGK